MELSNYSILIITMAIIFYLFGKKKKKDVVIEKLIPQELNDFSNESEEEFCERCLQFITRWCDKYKIPLVVSNDKKIFRMTAKHRKGSINYYIYPFFINGKKLLKFNTRSLDVIPDEKMEVLSELVHRINTILVFGTLYLDYNTKVFGNRLIWDVSNSELNEQQLNFYYKALEATNLTRVIFRIMHQDHNAESVAKDWPYC